MSHPARFARSLAVAGVATMSVALGTLAGAGSSFAQGTAKPALSGSAAASELSKVAAAAAAESKATFYLTYTTSGGSSSSGPVSMAQKPPEQMFKTGTGEAIYNGKTAYYCGEQNSSWTCITYPSLGESPIAAVMNFYSAAVYVEVMQGWEGILAARIAGVHIKFTSAKFAGQASTCVTWSFKGSQAEYCVTDKGILAYVGGGSGHSSSSFELTYYSPHVSSSDFSLPKGAKIESIP